MSKYLGKLLLERGTVSKTELETVCVKYSKKADKFYFETATGHVFAIGSELALAMSQLKGYLPWQYQWSIGYAVKILKGPEHFYEMRYEELNHLGGRRELVLNGQLDNDEDFDYLCAIQYMYKFSYSILNRIRGHWRRDKGYVVLEKRILGKGGRKLGSKNINDSCEEESKEEILFRIEHNKHAAVARGFYEWYLEACKEECKILGLKLDKDKVLEQWNKLRREYE